MKSRNFGGPPHAIFKGGIKSYFASRFVLLQEKSLFAGPVFTREVVTVPRRLRLYIARATYVLALGVLGATAWLVLAGTQSVRNTGDMARYGAAVFQMLAAVQLALAVFFPAFFAAAAVSHEKDRNTLALLLLTRMSNSELVLGKLFSSLLVVLTMLAASLPFFLFVALFGGVSWNQILRVYLVTLGTVFVAGSLGTTIAFWRDSTFQTLALTALVLVSWLGLGEVMARSAATGGVPREQGLVLPAADWVSPWRAMLASTQPVLKSHPNRAGETRLGFLASAMVTACLLNGITIARVRKWNEGQDTRPREEEGEPTQSIWSTERVLAEPVSPATGRSAHAARRRTREVWDNPVLWREIRTWSHGRKIIVVHMAYLVLAALAAWLLHRSIGAGLVSRAAVALPVVPLVVVSLVLINAVAVTSITHERDARALDLLLVTDLTPREFIFGKLGGIAYNAAVMLAAPLLLFLHLHWLKAVSVENAVYLAVGLLVLDAFVAVLGIHCGLAHGVSRNAILVSLGTVFFLFLGVAVCMRIMVAFSGSFQIQLQPFLAIMLGGGVGLYVALGVRNPSSAIAWASFGCPFAMFYSITSYLMEPPQPLAIFLVTSIAFGFATTAMLVPAIYEFDVATGRTLSEEE